MLDDGALPARAPYVPGAYRLRPTLLQDGGPSFAGSDGGSLEIPVEVLGWPGAPTEPPVVESLPLP